MPLTELPLLVVLAPVSTAGEARHALKGYLEAKLDALRKRNDHKTLSPTDTAHLRGRIAEVSRMLAELDPVTSQDVYSAAADEDDAL